MAVFKCWDTAEQDVDDPPRVVRAFDAKAAAEECAEQSYLQSECLETERTIIVVGSDGARTRWNARGKMLRVWHATPASPDAE